MTTVRADLSAPPDVRHSQQHRAALHGYVAGHDTGLHAIPHWDGRESVSTTVTTRRPASHHSASGVGIRLALFCDSFLPQLNGVALVLSGLVAAVRARGGSVRVYTTSDPAGAEADDVRRWPSVAFWAYPEHRLALPTQGRVQRELRAWEPTLIHAASPFGMGLAARAASRALGVPFVTSYHTNWSAYSTFYRLGALRGASWQYLRWFHNGGVRTYCPTRAVERELVLHGFHGTALWGRGVDRQVFNPAHRSQSLRERLGVAGDSVLAIYVGRLGAEKGLDVALASMHQVGRLAPGRVRFALAGDGPYGETVRRLAPPDTIFMGRLTGRELSEFYASADLFVFPSTTDTFGNVLLEAMASSLPVVAADAGPTRELLADHKGVTFPAGDSDTLAKLILELANAPERRTLLARRGLSFARRCTWERIWDDLIADYRIVQDHGSTALASRRPIRCQATTTAPASPV
jgi:phosphatidylinositol alpha 1,6-mannosyltransferase